MGDAADSSSSKPLRIMIVGDSITHGSEGDYTWRYRIWEWFQTAASSQPITFVGPYIGTGPADEYKPPQPPRFPDEPEPPPRDCTTGGYNESIHASFQREHFAHTGRAVFQAKDAIHEQVTNLNPDLLLVLLGFNDMGWGFSDHIGTLENTLAFIANARLAKPDISIALSNVPQRSPIPGREDLVDWTTKYNNLLKHAIKADRLDHLSKFSRLELVDVASVYGWSPDECAGAFDGLHPNELGEFQIASAFSTVLHKSFNIGTAPLSIPRSSKIPKRPLHTPTNPACTGVPWGIHFSWDPVYGSRGYDVRSRCAGQEEWEESHHGECGIDNTFTPAGQEWEFQVRAKVGVEEKDKSDWSAIARGIATRSTAPPPENREVYSRGKDGIEVTFTPLPTDSKFEVERYAVNWVDETAGGFLGGQGVRLEDGGRCVVQGLEVGHRYQVWISTWTKKEGGGVFGDAGKVVVGSGVFSRPEGLSGDLERLSLEGGR
ncbi:unnamed protein product [Zymoseptoria tritici ST99CH_1E4]|uniref:Fibronectin type-III domain-containing protein n=1 Tax=Zymoseptoria tritici ST99CH_1E4 TaxID=1276532 RepID=A0A2H1GUE4_ZYMTR|nr:unnamed protein product [Zymoseptoria tritici ST99CH_1E4]